MWNVEVRDERGVIHDRATFEQGRLQIGRSRQNDLVIFDPVISMRHAWLFVRDGQLWIADMDSTNGVIVDGQKISQPQPIQANSQIELAKFTLVVMPVETEQKTRAADSPANEDQDPLFDSLPDSPPGTASDMLSQKIQSIRSHREQKLSASEQRKQAFESEWAEVVDELRALRQRITSLDSVMFFTISRDGGSVSMKIKRTTRPKSILMTRGHPDRPVAGEERIFIRDHEYPDNSFTEPRKALHEFLSHIASLLA